MKRKKRLLPKKDNETDFKIRCREAREKHKAYSLTVTINGYGGSGKSTLARYIKTCLDQFLEVDVDDEGVHKEHSAAWLGKKIRGQVIGPVKIVVPVTLNRTRLACSLCGLSPAPWDEGKARKKWTCKVQNKYSVWTCSACNKGKKTKTLNW